VLSHFQANWSATNTARKAETVGTEEAKSGDEMEAIVVGTGLELRLGEARDLSDERTANRRKTIRTR
jgi:hypothetical protein